MSDKKHRWRDTKKGISPSKPLDNHTPNQIISASIGVRLKAFITDMFMIMMPIAYITTYLVMDGKDDFQESTLARWGISILYGIIVILFWSLKAQTPGYRAYNIILWDEKTDTKPTFIKSLVRYMAFLFSATSIVGVLLPFFRKDKKTLQDLLSRTYQKQLDL